MRCPRSHKVAEIHCARRPEWGRELEIGATYIWVGVRVVFGRDGRRHASIDGTATGPAAMGAFPARRAVGGHGWIGMRDIPNEGNWTHADLACGMGGFTWGARALGGRLVAACDIEPAAVQAFNAAHFATSGIAAEVQCLRDRKWWRKILTADVITAGFPCQPFSGAGSSGGFADYRGNIIFVLAEICRVVRPPMMVMECVWRFFANGQWAGPAVRAFTSLGYHVRYKRIDTTSFLPQERERWIMHVIRGDAAVAMGSIRGPGFGWNPPG